jgi:hypothetical protein
MMMAREFAALLPEIFSASQLAWIRGRTSLGPSALQVVQRAVGAAMKRDRAESERVGREVQRMMADGSWR